MPLLSEGEQKMWAGAALLRSVLFISAVMKVYVLAISKLLSAGDGIVMCICFGAMHTSIVAVGILIGQRKPETRRNAIARRTRVLAGARPLLG